MRLIRLFASGAGRQAGWPGWGPIVWSHKGESFLLLGLWRCRFERALSHLMYYRSSSTGLIFSGITMRVMSYEELFGTQLQPMLSKTSMGPQTKAFNQVEQNCTNNLLTWSISNYFRILANNKLFITATATQPWVLIRHDFFLRHDRTPFPAPYHAAAMSGIPKFDTYCVRVFQLIHPTISILTRLHG